MNWAVSRPAFQQWMGVVPALLIIPSLLFFYFSTKPPSVPAPPWYTQPAPCTQTKSALGDLVTLALDMHGVLNSLQVPHCLCYGTLWGALRQGRLLPWDTNIDVCAMDVHLANVSSRQLKEAFLRKGVLLEYDWRTGVYHAHSHRGVEGHIAVFTTSRSWQNGVEEEEMAVPGGWAKMVWRWLGQKQVAFPRLLLDAPFREELFHGQPMPVPHEGIELLKYLYPDDWWLEVKPPGCA